MGRHEDKLRDRQETDVGDIHRERQQTDSETDEDKIGDRQETREQTGITSWIDSGIDRIQTQGQTLGLTGDKLMDRRGTSRSSPEDVPLC